MKHQQIIDFWESQLEKLESELMVSSSLSVITINEKLIKQAVLFLTHLHSLNLENDKTECSVENNELLLSEEYLLDIHPELTYLQAASLKEFCMANTIIYKECYGLGQIMFPKWLEYIENINI